MTTREEWAARTRSFIACNYGGKFDDPEREGAWSWAMSRMRRWCEAMAVLDLRPRRSFPRVGGVAPSGPGCDHLEPWGRGQNQKHTLLLSQPYDYDPGDNGMRKYAIRHGLVFHSFGKDASWHFPGRTRLLVAAPAHIMPDLQTLLDGRSFHPLVPEVATVIMSLRNSDQYKVLVCAPKEMGNMNVFHWECAQRSLRSIEAMWEGACRDDKQVWGPWVEFLAPVTETYASSGGDGWGLQVMCPHCGDRHVHDTGYEPGSVRFHGTRKPHCPGHEERDLPEYLIVDPGVTADSGPRKAPYK